MEKIRLSLNKETIANLNNSAMSIVNGGGLCSEGDCPASEPATYCPFPGAIQTDCNSACGTSCNYTACYTWCNCLSIATGTCC